MFGKIWKFFKFTLKFTIALCFFAALFVGITNLIVIVSAEDNIVTVEKASENKADCIIVLGCSVYSDGTPSPMLKDRLLKAVELYNAGAADKIIMSGDHGGQYYNEVKVMKNFAIQCGVPSEDIFLDHYGLSTYDTMYRADAVFEIKKAVVVTQRYHLSRAVYIAQRFGIDAIGVECDTVEYSGQLYRDLREVGGRTKDFLYCILKPEPEHLGDVIPVEGNGDVTNDRPV